MKKNIPFRKDLLFKTKVAEIAEINLLEEITNRTTDSISGNFNLTGSYKMHLASRLAEDFDFNIPFDIALDERFNTKNSTLKIIDFRYEIVNGEILRTYIDVELDNLITENLEPIEVREETKTEIEVEKEVETETSKTKEEIEITVTDLKDDEELEIEEDVNTIFKTLGDADETYSTYNVYMMKEEDTLDAVIDKYGTNLDTLARYNKLDSIKPGDKLIFPLTKDHD